MELNMNEKVTVKNLCNWDLYFKRLEGHGDVKVPASKTTRLSREEVVAQVENGNRLFTGTDGKGTNAKIFIEDKDTRMKLEFETDEEKQEVFTVEEAKRIIGLKTFSSFKDNIEKKVVTHSEKAVLAEEAKKSKLNDFEKIKFIEEHTGFKIIE